MRKKPDIAEVYEVPGWVEIFSYLHLSFLLMPACLVSFLVLGQDLSVEFFGFAVRGRENLLGYGFLLMLLFVGGLVAVGILRRKRWGLTLGLCYTAVAMLVCLVSLALTVLSRMEGESALLGLILLGMFARWIITTLPDQKQGGGPALSIS